MTRGKPEEALSEMESGGGGGAGTGVLREACQSQQWAWCEGSWNVESGGQKRSLNRMRESWA